MNKILAISAVALLVLSTTAYAGSHNQASDTGRENSAGGESEKGGEKAVGTNGTPPGLDRE